MKENGLKEKTEENKNAGKSGSRSRFFVALAATVLAAAFFGLSFVPLIGVYFLTASVLTEIAALSFLNAQKKLNNFPAVKILSIIAYMLLFLSVALFTGGLIYSSLNS